MRMVDIIEKKRGNHFLTKEEIDFVIQVGFCLCHRDLKLF